MTDPGGEAPRTLTSIKQYRLVRELGRGGMGVVYEGVDTRDGSRVAVKLLHPWLVSSDPSYRDRFEREAHVAALLRSPYTVRLVDFGVAEENYFLVMEYVDGSSLADLIAQGPIEPMRALRIAIDVARGLEEAVARGVVHRDIKPANVMITTDGRVKVTDFGIARHEGGSGLTAAGAFVGTAEYAAPEQAIGESDHRSDIYALGGTLYCMLAGHPPFRAATVYDLLTMHQSEPLPAEPLAHLPEAIVNPIRRCMEKDPRDRYQTPSELANALERAMTSLGRTQGGASPASGGRPGATSARASQGSSGGLRPTPVAAPRPPGPAAPAASMQPTRAPAAPSHPRQAEAATRVAGPAAAPRAPAAAPLLPQPSAPPPFQAPPSYPPPVAYPPPPPMQPARRRSRAGMWIALAASVLVAAGVAGAVVLFAAGGDDGDEPPPAGATPTEAPPSATAAETSTTAEVSATAASTPTPAPEQPTPTPTQVLPTPVLQGFPAISLPATSPEREIVDAVNRNGPAYSAAIYNRDESLLTGVFAGEALEQYRQSVAGERDKPDRSQNALLSIELRSLDWKSLGEDGRAANVETLETWRFQSGNTCTRIVYEEFYQLALIDGSWYITKNQYVQRSATPC